MQIYIRHLLAHSDRCYFIQDLFCIQIQQLTNYLTIVFRELVIKHKEYLRRVTKLKMQANQGAKFYKGYDKLEQLREAVRLKIALNMSGEGKK